MDPQKRQKIILVAVCVLALGAGVVWYTGRDSGQSQSAAFVEGDVVRRDKADKEEASSRRTKADVRSTTREEPRTVERKERETRDDTSVERRKARQDKTKEKKKVIAPAA